MVFYKGKPIGDPGWGWAQPHTDYICSFVDLGIIVNDPSATEEQVKAAKEEIETAMDDFS